MHGTFTLAASLVSEVPPVEPNPPLKKIALFMEDGGSWGKHSAAAAQTILADARFELAFVAGSSIGAITGHAAVYGWNEGMAQGGINAARIGAVQAIETRWRDLINAPTWQTNATFLMHETRTTAMQTAENIWSGFLNAQAMFMPPWLRFGVEAAQTIPQQMRMAFENMAMDMCGSATKGMIDNPIPAILAADNKNRNWKNYSEGPAFLIGNATKYRENPFRSTADDEITFSTHAAFHAHGLAPITSTSQLQNWVAGSGHLDNYSSFKIEGQRVLDGGFSSMQSYLDAADYCRDMGIKIIVLRTRPTGAFAFGDHAEGSIAHRRAYHGTKWDRLIEQMRAMSCDIDVIEPSKIMPDIGSVPSELRFDAASAKAREQDGAHAAQVYLQTIKSVPPEATPEPRTNKTGAKQARRLAA